MIDVCTAALLPTKPSSHDDSGSKHGFGAETSLPLTLSALAQTQETLLDCRKFIGSPDSR